MTLIEALICASVVVIVNGNVFKLPDPPNDVIGNQEELIKQYHDYYQEYNARQPDDEIKKGSSIPWYFIKTIAFIIIIIALMYSIFILAIHIYNTLLGYNRLTSLRTKVMNQLPPGQGYDTSGKLIRYTPLRKEVKAYDKLMKTLHNM